MFDRNKLFSKVFGSVSLLAILTGFSAQANGPRIGEYSIESTTKTPIRYLNLTGVDKLRKMTGVSGKGAKAVIIDNYIDPTHLALSDQLTESIIPGRCEKGMCSSHGTFTTGIVHNMAREARLKFVSRYQERNGRFVRDDNAVVNALKVAVRSSGDVVNMSFGLGHFSTPVFEVMQEVVDSGKVIFLAFGNEGGKAPQYTRRLIEQINDPRLKGHVVLVSNLQYEFSGHERLSPSSDYVMPDTKTPHAICAPGTNILSTAEGGNMKFLLVHLQQLQSLQVPIFC